VKLAGWIPHDVLAHAAEEHGRDVAEGIRVAYVAATRARDVLVVPAIGDPPYGQRYLNAEDWWIEPLYSTLYPPEERRQTSTRAKRCPEFGIDSVLHRPNDEPAYEVTVRPGAHSFGAGSSAYTVVWWDPKTLELGKVPSFSIRQQELLENAGEDIVKKRLSDYRAWRNARAELLSRGAFPSIRFQTATERSRSELPFPVEVQIIDIAKEARPYGPRFGALVHSVLASVPLDRGEMDISSAAELHGRILGATDDELKAAIVVVTVTLQHPLMRRARAAAARGDCHRELPLTLRMEDGILIEGVADLVFRESKKWVVVDFKTARELANELDRYRRQVSIYAKTISELHKAETTACLFRI
jgi:ATP-dependent exoDNAse (exonuclease V) beta subunit